MILSVKNLHKTFKQGQNSLSVIDQLEFSLPKASSMAILGKSGSGKTTLLSILAGLETADSGEMIFDGIPLMNLSEKALTEWRAKKIGIVFQQYHLVSTLTALENVQIPLLLNDVANPHERAMKLLEQVGLKERAHHFPSQLSGGENQRVAIARALSANPKLILADEPSGNLDEETGEKVMSLLFELVKKNGLSLILVTHDQDLAKKCDRIFFLEQGKIHPWA